VGDLKQEIKKVAQLEPATHTLTLYKVEIDVSETETFENVMKDISLSSIKANKKALSHPLYALSEYFDPSKLPAKTIHILVKLPAGDSINSRVVAPSLSRFYASYLHRCYLWIVSPITDRRRPHEDENDQERTNVKRQRTDQGGSSPVESSTPLLVQYGNLWLTPS
jgi:Crinkler effector protein N-terminal domain